MEPIHRRRDFLQRASALLLSGTLLGGCAARRPAPGPAAPQRAHEQGRVFGCNGGHGGGQEAESA
ncbi:hypothetical protein WLV97_23765 [Bordetella bronchiseptica]